MHVKVVYNNLFKATQEVAAALFEIDHGNQSLAIGTMFQVPDRLDTAKTFCDAILRIHRQSR